MRILLALVLSVVIATSCNKQSNDDVYISGEGLVGKWMATDRFWSPGVGGTWFPLDAGEKFTIEFKSDSTFSYSSNFPKADSLFSSYSTNNSMLIVTSPSNKRDVWFYTTNSGDTLHLAIFTCIEGCPFQLRRIK